MNRNTAYLLIAAVAGLAAAVALSDWSPLTAKANQQAVASGWAGTTWSPTQPRVPYYCRGGLFHPPLAGQGRSALIAEGWGWIADPPGEHSGPGVSDG